MRLAEAALRRTGHEPTYALSGGGADANVFNLRGLACLNLANGMAEIHTPQEHIAVADLEGMVEVTLALLDGGAWRLASAAAPSPRCWSGTTAWRGSRWTATPCVAYPRLTGPVALGDEVVVNTQARDLGLGSGGFDVLYVNLTRGLGLAAEPDAHVMKLPYTPGQAAVRHVEEWSGLDESSSTACRSSAARCTARSRRSVRR